ncbi:MAG: hypothetical protein KC503_32795 [Myxococcales bacterium]|nr:hypothetical protein [Myxococcales bacterium]
MLARVLVTLVLTSLLALTAGCSDSTGGATDGSVAADSGQRADGGSSADGATPTDGSGSLDAALSGCGPGTYPCGPYGSKVGDTIDNLTFKGFFDPNFLCRGAGAMKPDTATPREISLGHFFRGDSRCPGSKKKVLWVFVSAGWCHACEQQMAQLAPTYNAGQIDPAVEVFNVLFENTPPGTPATEAFAKTYIDHHQGTFPMAIDPTFKTRVYFPINATPLNFLVDLDTMKIFYAVNGADLQGIGKAIQDHLAGR